MFIKFHFLEFSCGNSPRINAAIAKQTNSKWDYSNLGPEKWPSLFDTCRGSLQSPINIITNQVRFDPSLKNFEFIDYDRDYNYRFYSASNSGNKIYIFVG
jgi:carbonic anhydrase